uniref:G-protein coupled receptors family 1 profile domain-containing protein n=1 Tax=Anopheles culicifacies TaxID=139723 RepID=A0A182M3S4_9DIPT
MFTSRSVSTAPPEVNVIGASLHSAGLVQSTLNGTLATVASVISSAAGSSTLASLTMAPTSGGGPALDGGGSVWNGTVDESGTDATAVNLTEPTASTIVEPADRLVELTVLCLKSLIFGSIIIGAVLGNALVIISVHKNRKLR